MFCAQNVFGLCTVIAAQEMANGKSLTEKVRETRHLHAVEPDLLLYLCEELNAIIVTYKK